MLASLGLSARARAQPQEIVRNVDRSHPVMEELWPGMRESRTTLPPFLRDTMLTLRLRNYYEGYVPTTGLNRAAWAFGSVLAYRSGWLLNGFQIGAAYYGAAPVYPPVNKGDDVLLARGHSGYQVLGEAFAALRYQGYAVLKAYRQEVKQPYVNRGDIRMTPIAFEGVTLGGAVGAGEYFAGYLTRIKKQNEDRFVPMSEAAMAPGTNYGAGLLGVKLKPLSGLSVQISEVYGVNTFNTLFAQAEHVSPVAHDFKLQVGVQFTDQRAVGKALAYTTRVTRWNTRNGSARIALTYRDLTVKGAASITASGNKIRGPWGLYPGYLFVGLQQFNNANEKAWLAGVAYDFSNLIVPGLTAWADLAWGVDSIDPVKRVALGNEAEYDLVMDYRPPWIQGLTFRVRGLLYHQEIASRLGHVVRFIVNWEIPLL